MRQWTATIALIGFVPCGVSAQQAVPDDKYTFFAQPSVPRTQVLADFDECRELASGVQPPQPGYQYTPNLAAAATAGFLQGLQKGAQRRQMFDAALRKCLSLKGYNRYALTKDQAKVIYSGSWPQLREKLADRALASTDGFTRLDP